MRQYSRQRQVNIVKPEQYTRAVENGRKCSVRSLLRRLLQKPGSFLGDIPSANWRMQLDAPSFRGEEIFREVRLTAQKARPTLTDYDSAGAGQPGNLRSAVLPIYLRSAMPILLV